MNSSLTIAVLAGLGGMFGWGLADFFAKSAVDRLGPIRSLVWAHLFGALSFVAVAFVQTVILGRSLTIPDQASTWLGLLFFGVLQMLVYYAAYLAFEKGKVALLNPIFASFTGIVALVSILFLGEQTSALFVVALGLIFAGVMFLNVETEGYRLKKITAVDGLTEILIATALATGWTLGWNRFLSNHDALSYALFMYIFMSAAAYALARLTKTKLSGVPKTAWKVVFAMGATETIAYLAISWGYSATTRTSVVALISGAFSVPTVVLAYIFLKERLTVVQATAIGTIIAGVILIAIQ